MIRLQSAMSLAGVAVFAAVSLHPALVSGQAAGFQSKPILQTFLSDDDRKETVMMAISIAPGGSSGRHTHPGDCYGTVVEGSVEVHADGREVRRVAAGEVYHNGRGVVHEIRNAGSAPARAVHTLVIDKGQPRLTPAK
ncbi:MAG: cupin domain-containing protein [Burkholderiales bacterium]|nr:cupin domain-containing protein [Burkholderiales bacterium]